MIKNKKGFWTSLIITYYFLYHIYIDGFGSIGVGII